MDGRFIPLLRLGVGARADIYLGHLQGDGDFQTLVVLKRALGVAVTQEEAITALRREAEIGVLCRHPNVVSTTELCRIPEGLVLVMEYVNGVTFGSLIAHLARDGARVPGPIAARLVADAAHGLAHVHAATTIQGLPCHLVHTDVSPANLLLGEDGFARLADFGCAGPEERSSGEALFFANPPYCAPEHIEGRGAQQASDTFALGMVLRSLLTGGQPVVGTNIDEQLAAVCGGDFSALPDDTDQTLAQLVREMSAREPESRPSMREVAVRLEELSVGLGGNREQVRSFLLAEMGAALHQRRRRLREFAKNGGQMVARESTATFAILDAILDGSLPELAATRVDVGSPRE